jgi:hypothetical protein
LKVLLVLMVLKVKLVLLALRVQMVLKVKLVQLAQAQCLRMRVTAQRLGLIHLYLPPPHR